MRLVWQPTVKLRRAAAATELAIALPFLSFVFAAGLDFARIYYATQTLEHCAYVGCLYASGTARTAPSTQSSGVTQQDRTDAAVAAAVAEGVSLSPDLASNNVQVAYSGGYATVTVTYNFGTLTPVVNTSRNVGLTRVVKMRQLY